MPITWYIQLGGKKLRTLHKRACACSALDSALTRLSLFGWCFTLVMISLAGHGCDFMYIANSYRSTAYPCAAKPKLCALNVRRMQGAVRNFLPPSCILPRPYPQFPDSFVVSIALLTFFIAYTSELYQSIFYPCIVPSSLAFNVNALLSLSIIQLGGNEIGTPLA